jgi:hypothetical protein
MLDFQNKGRRHLDPHATARARGKILCRVVAVVALLVIGSVFVLSGSVPPWEPQTTVDARGGGVSPKGVGAEYPAGRTNYDAVAQGGVPKPQALPHERLFWTKSTGRPGSTELDALADVGPLLLAFNLTHAGLPLAEDPTLDDRGVSPPLGARAVGFFGGGGFGGGSGGGEPNGGTTGGASQGFATSPSFGDSLEDPSPIDGPSEADPSDGDLPKGDQFRGTQFKDDPSGGDPFAFDPSEVDSLVLQTTPGGDPAPSNFSQSLPINPTPVPEPATLFLFGSGIAGLFARHRRRKAN